MSPEISRVSQMGKRLAVVMCAALMLAMPVLAQTQSTAQRKVQISGKVLGIMGGGTGLVAADAGTVFDISPQFSPRTDSIFVSAAASQANIASYNLAGAQRPFSVAAIFKKLGLDGANYIGYVFGEIGTVTNAAGTSRAYSAGAGLDRKLPDGFTLNLFEARWLHGPVAVGDTPGGAPRYLKDTVAFSIGLIR